MPLNIDWQQILLHLLNFVILFAGLWLLLYKPVRKFMHERRERYEKTDAEAKKKLAEAEQTRAEYEKKLSAADAEIEEKRAAARREMDGYEARRKQAAQEEAHAIHPWAREHAAREKTRAVEEARGEIVGLVTEAAEKIATKSASEAYDAFLAAADEQTPKDGEDA